MPKMKRHTGIGKRVRVTGSGRLMREKSGLRKKLEKKPSTMTRRLSGRTEVDKTETKRIKKMLGL